MGAAPIPGTGTATIRVADVGGRVTPLPPRDQLNARVTVRSGNRTFEVTGTHAMVEDPLGRHTTWWGVGFDADHHGRTGVGSSDLPPIESKVAAFGVARVRVDGKLVGTSVPIHVMTVDHGEIPGVRFAIDVGDPDLPVPGTQGGMLRVAWPAYEGQFGEDAHLFRYLLGAIILALLLAIFLGAEARRGEGLAS
jgi:hypothetical protein